MTAHTSLKSKGDNVQGDVSSRRSVESGLVLECISGLIGDTAFHDGASPSNIAGVAVLELRLQKMPHLRGGAVCYNDLIRGYCAG